MIADDLRTAILAGAVAPGSTLPTVKQLGVRYHVDPSTAHRAVALLAGEHLVAVSRGRRAVVNRVDHADRTVASPSPRVALRGMTRGLKTLQPQRPRSILEVDSENVVAGRCGGGPAPAASQGGSAGSNPVGATYVDQPVPQWSGLVGVSGP